MGGYRLKKKFLNNPIMFFISVAFIISFFVFLVLLLISKASVEQKFTGFWVLSVLILLSSIIAVPNFEIITICDDCITSYKVYKFTQIYYNEIIEHDNYTFIYGQLGNLDAWSYTDGSKNIIYIIKFKCRQNFIDYINEKVNKN